MITKLSIETNFAGNLVIRVHTKEYGYNNRIDFAFGKHPENSIGQIEIRNRNEVYGGGEEVDVALASFSSEVWIKIFKAVLEYYDEAKGVPPNEGR